MLTGHGGGLKMGLAERTRLIEAPPPSQTINWKVADREKKRDGTYAPLWIVQHVKVSVIIWDCRGRRQPAKERYFMQRFGVKNSQSYAKLNPVDTQATWGEYWESWNLNDPQQNPQIDDHSAVPTDKFDFGSVSTMKELDGTHGIITKEGWARLQSIDPNLWAPGQDGAIVGAGVLNSSTQRPVGGWASDSAPGMTYHALIWEWSIGVPGEKDTSFANQKPD